MTDCRIVRLEKEPTWENIANSISEDIAGRNEDLLAFIELLRRIDGPYTVMLDASWGEGKTFFIRSVQYIMYALNPSSPVEIDANDLRISKVIKPLEDSGYPTFLPLYFNAWENDDAEDPMSALFAVLASQLDQEYLTRRPKLKEGMLKVVDAAIAAISPLSISNCATNIYSALRGEDLVASYRKRSELKNAVASMTETGNIEVADKLVIFIDELDRCRPDFAVRLLEQIKSLFQGENIITVISADSVQLAKAMAGIYGEGYDSQRFLERFYDYRMTLSPCDSFKVATGRSFQRTTSRFDALEIEMINSRALTPRDMMRILPKLNDARNFAEEYSNHAKDVFKHNLADMVANCAFLPILIFIQREDGELFRSITAGTDFDSLYEEGRKYPAFVDSVQRGIAFARSYMANAKSEISDDDIKQYVHDLCVVIFSPDRSGEEIDDAKHRLGMMGESLPVEVYKTLNFPDVQEDDAEE